MKPGLITRSVVIALALASFGVCAEPSSQPHVATIVNSRIREISQNSDSYYRPATIECVIGAAQRRGVPANVLLGIASIEMGGNGDRLQNANKSHDLGHFGINSIHFRPGEPLAKAGVRPQDVAKNGCYNAEVAAWLLAGHLRRQRGENFWVWAANYHSTTPEFNAVYRKKLIRFSEEWGRWLQYRYPQVSIYQPHPQGNQQ